MVLIMCTFSNVQEKATQNWKNKLAHYLACAIFVSASVSALPVQAGFEKAADLKASSFLKPEIIKGKNYVVQDKVKNDGLFNHFTVKTDFATFQADSSIDLKILINEINAIVDMKKVDTKDVALDSLMHSGEKAVSGVKNLFNEPQKTLEGAASGIGSLFNRAKETVGHRENSDAEDSSLEQLVGISKSKGIIASKYGVNVYSRNEVLQKELDRLGQADFVGGLGVGVATSFVPGVGGLVMSTAGTARLLNDAVNTTPASELWLQNKNKLTKLGMDADTVELFLNNPSFSPARSTVLVAALESMKGVDNLDFFIKVSLQASDEVMAVTITRIAVMTAAYHKKVAPLQAIAPMARLTQGVRKDGTRVILLPMDYIIWNKQVAGAVEAANNDAKGKNTELWIFGTVSKQAAAEMKQLGWKVQTNVAAKLKIGQ